MLSNKTILFYFFLFPILLCAEGSLSSYQLGYSSNSVKSDIPANAGGLYTGIDFIKIQIISRLIFQYNLSYVNQIIKWFFLNYHLIIS
jgi:hypothetical protein